MREDKIKTVGQFIAELQQMPQDAWSLSSAKVDVKDAIVCRS